ncbi:MAG: hypothetical protein HOQ24_13805 [Mycobacteriaceae bacterium]|nr:hypothetical protein [Mycobacteriaceae bacterium]
MGYKKGDEVAARKDLGGVTRDSVPAGSKGTVTKTSWTGEPTEATFRVGNESRTIRVNGREVR